MQIKDGDIFRWKFKNEEEYLKKHQGSGTAYWCLDRQCFVIDGKLVDTYWQGINKERYSSHAKVVSLDEVELEFICNIENVRFIHKGEIEDYDQVYNLSHQKGCYPCFAVDKDAKVSNKALKKKYINEYSRLTSEKKYLENRISWLDGELSRLEVLEDE